MPIAATSAEVDRRPPSLQWNGLEPHRSSLVGFLGQRGRCRFEIDDIVQETFLRAARFRRNQVPDELLRPWLFSIARNVFLDQLRRNSRYEYSPDHEHLIQVREDAQAVQEEESGAELDFQLDGRVLDPVQLLRQLPVALAELPLRDQRLLEHYYGDDGGSCRRTGEAVSLAAELVKVRLYRARRKLQRIMRRNLRLAEGPCLRTAV